jgi:CubicO group peptidase (beta-lactamase class C family)
MILARLIAVFLCLPLVIGAQKNYPSLLDEFMQAQARFSQFSGAVLIEQNGKILYKKAFGLANREWNVPNTIDTKFRIAAITKQFTAAAILQLVDKGKLSLEDKLSKYFPDFPKGDSVTIHMLLNHTSGINNSPGLSIFALLPVLAHSKDSLIALHKKLPYDFSPGTNFKYNNFGYFLLGYN